MKGESLSGYIRRAELFIFLISDLMVKFVE